MKILFLNPIIIETTTYLLSGLVIEVMLLCYLASLTHPLQQSTIFKGLVKWLDANGVFKIEGFGRLTASVIVIYGCGAVYILWLCPLYLESKIFITLCSLYAFGVLAFVSWSAHDIFGFILRRLVK